MISKYVYVNQRNPFDYAINLFEREKFEKVSKLIKKNTHLVDVVLEMPAYHFWNPRKHNFSTCIISNQLWPMCIVWQYSWTQMNWKKQYKSVKWKLKFPPHQVKNIYDWIGGTTQGLTRIV